MGAEPIAPWPGEKHFPTNEPTANSRAHSKPQPWKWLRSSLQVTVQQFLGGGVRFHWVAMALAMV